MITQVPRPTSFRKWGGSPMVLKVGNFSSQACTDQNSCGIGNCGTDLDFRTSQLAPCIAELRFHPPSAELELNLSRPPCAPGQVFLFSTETTFVTGVNSSWGLTGCALATFENAQWIKTNQYGLASYQTSKLITHFIIYSGEK